MHTYLTWQWAAVITQFGLMREPPQKWKPFWSWDQGLERWEGPSHSRHEAPRTLAMPLGAGTCRDTCQGQDPDTAFSPLTILWLKLSAGPMAGTPQPGHCTDEDPHPSPLLPSSSPWVPQQNPN